MTGSFQDTFLETFCFLSLFSFIWFISSRHSLKLFLWWYLFPFRASLPQGCKIHESRALSALFRRLYLYDWVPAWHRISPQLFLKWMTEFIFHTCDHFPPCGWIICISPQFWFPPPHPSLLTPWTCSPTLGVSAFLWDGFFVYISRKSPLRNLHCPTGIVDLEGRTRIGYLVHQHLINMHPTQLLTFHTLPACSRGSEHPSEEFWVCGQA